MTGKDLKSQLEGLFSDTGLEPEAETEKSELLLEEAIVGLLGSKATAEPAATEPMVVAVPPSVQAEPEEDNEEREAPAASVCPSEVPLREQRTRILNILLHSVTILGGVLLVFLLICLIWQEPMTWSELHALYFAAYAVAFAITLIQWMINFSFGRAPRNAEEKHAEAIRSQAFLTEQADELATANAMLQKRTLQLQTAAEICQATASVLDPDELVQRAVKLIHERFDLYYVGLFLIDESGQWAVLRAGTGEAGRRMVAQGYRLEVGSTSTVGWCTANAQIRIAPDLSAASRPSLIEVNSLLPEARSEMALPLRSRGRGIGALSVQSTERDAFSQEDTAVLQTLADHIAAAIDNAQLFAETRARLEEMEARQRRDVRERWTDSASAQAARSYERIRPGVTPLGKTTMSGDFGELSRAVEQAMARQEVVVQPDTGDGTGQAALVVPISLRGEALGALVLHETEGGRRWTDDEVALVEAVADQMALAIENTRLLEETRQRAERDRLIADITARVRSSMDPETILRTAVKELGAALGTDRAFVQLGTGTQPSEK